MNLEELSNLLCNMGIDEELFSIGKGGLPNERLCIAFCDKWQVYYSERGRKSGLKEFNSEVEACEYFLKKIKRYAKVD